MAGPPHVRSARPIPLALPTVLHPWVPKPYRGGRPSLPRSRLEADGLAVPGSKFEPSRRRVSFAVAPHTGRSPGWKSVLPRRMEAISAVGTDRRTETVIRLARAPARPRDYRIDCDGK